MRIGDIIKQARIKNGLTQIDVSEKLGFGSSQFICLIEKNKSKIPPSQIKKICKILGLDKNQIADILIQEYVIKIRKEIG